MKATLTSFTQDELYRLLAHMREHDPQLHTMALLSLNHGMRRGEILALEPKAFREGRITFIRLKGSLPCSAQKVRAHAVPEYNEAQAVDMLLKQSHKILPDGRVLLFDMGENTVAAEKQINRLMVRYCEAVGIPRHKAHWSSFKHTCGKMLVDTLGVPALQVHLGHVEVKNTLVYTKPSADEVEATLDAAFAQDRAMGVGAGAGGD
jgi:integrase